MVFEILRTTRQSSISALCAWVSTSLESDVWAVYVTIQAEHCFNGKEEFV
jgi:hypothetical protein